MLDFYGAVAQLVERQVEALRVGSSSLSGPTIWKCPITGIGPPWKGAWWEQNSCMEVRALPFPLTFGSIVLIGKAPGSNPVVRKFLM